MCSTLGDCTGLDNQRVGPPIHLIVLTRLSQPSHHIEQANQYLSNFRALSGKAHQEYKSAQSSEPSVVPVRHIVQGTEYHVQAAASYGAFVSHYRKIKKTPSKSKTVDDLREQAKPAQKAKKDLDGLDWHALTVSQYKNVDG